MSIRRVVARNIVWNYAGMGVTLVAGFVTAPYLVDRLGSTTYGLWILIGSFTGYFGLLDLGVRGSVGRCIAFHRGRQDHEAVNQNVTTALAILCVPAAITILGTLVTAFLFFSLFEVPPELAFDVRVALLIVGFNLALTFPASVFDGTLWAFQRFDAINAVDIVLVSARTGLTFYLIKNGHGLVALAALTLLQTVLAASVKGLIAHRVDGKLSIRPANWRRAHVRSLFGYSFWFFLFSVSRMFTSQLSRILIGSWIGVALVTPFSFGSSLIGYGTSLLVAWTGVLTPVATSFHAEEKHDQQRRLYLRGSRFCTYFALCLLGGYLLLGESFLTLWIPKEAAASFGVLVILALGEVLPMSQSIAGNILLGVARHKALAWITILEAAICGCLTMALINYRGLVGPSLAVALAAAFCRGLLVSIYGCRTIGCSYVEYLRHAILPPVIYVAPAAALLMAAVSWKAPENWFEFVGYSAVYGMSCALAGAALMNVWTFKDGFFWTREPTWEAASDPTAEAARTTAPAIATRDA